MPGQFRKLAIGVPTLGLDGGRLQVAEAVRAKPLGHLGIWRWHDVTGAGFRAGVDDREFLATLITEPWHPSRWKLYLQVAEVWQETRRVHVCRIYRAEGHVEPSDVEAATTLLCTHGLADQDAQLLWKPEERYGAHYYRTGAFYPPAFVLVPQRRLPRG